MATFADLAKETQDLGEIRKRLGIPPNEPSSSSSSSSSQKQKRHKEQKRPKQEDDLERLNQYKWDPSKKVEPTPPIARFAGRVEIRRKNVSALSSKSGDGKTSLVGGLISSLSGKDVDCLGWQGCERKGAVILFDYEQSPEDFDECCRRIWKRAGMDPPSWFYAYHLRDLKLEDRKRLTEIAITRVKAEVGAVDLVVLDGGSDLIEDVNDPKLAPKLVGGWLAMSSEYDCHIHIIVHLNESNQAGVDPRGWLGKELMRKCEAAFTLSKSNNRTKVHTAKHRKAGLSKDQAFAFEWSDSKQMHVSVGTVASERAERVAQRRQERLELVEAIYTPKSAGMQPLGAGLTYGQLVSAVIEIEGCSEPTAKRRITELKKENLIKYEWHNYYVTADAKAAIMKENPHA